MTSTTVCLPDKSKKEFDRDAKTLTVVLPSLIVVIDFAHGKTTFKTEDSISVFDHDTGIEKTHFIHGDGVIDFNSGIETVKWKDGTQSVYNHNTLNKDDESFKEVK